MTVYLFLLILVVFAGIKAAPAGSFQKDYMSKEKTNVVKGVFVILVFYKHARQYMNLGGPFDKPYIIMEDFMGQMIVAMFLFYSGYGMMEAIKKKGFSYVKGILCRRLPQVYFHFVIILLMFLILDLCLGQLSRYSVKTIALSFIGWENIGNSNWYMFVVFVLYLFMFLAFFLLRFFEGKRVQLAGACILTLLTAGFVYGMRAMGRPSYFYNTALLLPLGVWYSYLKKWIEKLMMTSELRYEFICLITIVLFAATSLLRSKHGIEVYTVWAVVFTLSIVFFTMKISIGNPVLDWFGNHVFSVYMLQRLPMIALAHRGIGHSHRYLFLVIVLICTIFLSHLFDTVMSRLSSRINEIRRKENI